jgi:hypothetical protein
MILVPGYSALVTKLSFHPSKEKWKQHAVKNIGKKYLAK